MFIFSINSSTILFRANASNIEYFIVFNNPIWIDTLCTLQSKTDAQEATNTIRNNPPSCAKHFLKTLIKSDYQ